MAANTKKHFIVDASFVTSFLLPDEISVKVEKIFSSFLAGSVELFSCSLLPYEVTNSLASAVLSKRITKDQALQLEKDFNDLKITLVSINLQKTLDFALKKRISVYDAAYMFLAKENKIKLLTLDTYN